MLALGAATQPMPQDTRHRDMETARELMDTCYSMYSTQPTGLAADTILLRQTSGFSNLDPEYKLRPETVESLYAMHSVTGSCIVIHPGKP